MVIHVCICIVLIIVILMVIMIIFNDHNLLSLKIIRIKIGL